MSYLMSSRITTGILKLWRNSSGTISRLGLMKAYVLFVRWIFFFPLVVIARYHYLVCTLCSLNWLIPLFFLQWFCFVWQQFCFPWAFLSMKLVVLHCRWDLNKNINRPSIYACRHLLDKIFLSDTARANQPSKINNHSAFAKVKCVSKTFSTYVPRLSLY